MEKPDAWLPEGADLSEIPEQFRLTPTPADAVPLSHKVANAFRQEAEGGRMTYQEAWSAFCTLMEVPNDLAEPEEQQAI